MHFSHLPVAPGVDCPLRSAVENVTGAHIATLILLVAAKITNKKLYECFINLTCMYVYFKSWDTPIECLCLTTDNLSQIVPGPGQLLEMAR